MSRATAGQIRKTLLWFLLLVGVGLSFLSLGADRLGLNLTPGFGMVQMLELLVGLTCLTLAGFLVLHGLRGDQAPRSLQADIGIRLAATGLVFAYASGLSDLLGIGTHVAGNGFERPFVGPLQLGGIVLGIFSILIGMFLFHTSRGARRVSSMDFLQSDE